MQKSALLVESKDGMVIMSFAEKIHRNFSHTLIEPEALSLLARISNLITEQNVEAYLVGGFVRDVLLGRATADIDIAVASDVLEIAPEVAAAFDGKYILLDKVN